MNTQISRRIRLGGLALALSALLFAAFPLVRPFFPPPQNGSSAEFTVVSQVLIAPSWVISHIMALIALVLLLFGMITFHAFLRDTKAERRVFLAMIFGVAGIALILPTLGVETYTLPVLGKVYLEGKTELAPIIGAMYSGPDTLILMLGLLLLAIGAILLAVAIWSSDTLPKWAGVILAVGLVFWFPLFPQIIRVVDGLFIGIGGLWLAWSIWMQTGSVPANASMAPDPAF